MEYLNIETLKAIILGIVEGLTEFIPVSSTGHLILLGDLLNFQGPPGKVFEIVIQLGAILAICWLYRQKLFDVLVKLPSSAAARKFAINIIVAFIPSAIVGATLHGFIKSVLFSPLVVAVMLVIGGFIILFVEKKLVHKIKFESVEAIPTKIALFIGMIQTLSVVPGTSRSGATIIGSLLLGLDRKTAAEFSFFLAIPTMLGATVYDVYKNYSSFNLDNIFLVTVGFIAAFLAALLVVSRVIKFISTHGFSPFAYYRIALGCLMLFILLG